MNHEVDGTGDEAPCPHCLFGQAGCCVDHLMRRAAPCLVNDQKRFKLYQQFWQLLKDLGVWGTSHLPGEDTHLCLFTSHTHTHLHTQHKQTHIYIHRVNKNLNQMGVVTSHVHHIHKNVWTLLWSHDPVTYFEMGQTTRGNRMFWTRYS